MDKKEELPTKSCRCGVGNWREIRRALSVTQTEFARWLGIHRLTLMRLEGTPHQCPNSKNVVWILESILRDPDRQAKLILAGVDNPFWQPTTDWLAALERIGGPESASSLHPV